MIPDFLPCKARNYVVKLDCDQGSDLTSLTFHCFGKLKRGDRVCVKGGRFVEEFGTVKRRDWRYAGYTYRIRKTRKITVSELPREPINFSVEVG